MAHESRRAITHPYRAYRAGTDRATGVAILKTSWFVPGPGFIGITLIAARVIALEAAGE